MQKARAAATAAGFIDFRNPSQDSLVFVTLCSAGTDVELCYSLVIKPDRTWTLEYRKKNVRQDGPVLNQIPVILDAEQLIRLLDCIHSSGVCSGHDRQEVLQSCKEKNLSTLYGSSKQEVAYILGNKIYTNDCCLLVPQGISRCDGCKKFGSNLRARASHYNKTSQIPTNSEKTKQNSFVPISTLTEAEKAARYKNMGKTLHNLQKKTKKQAKKLSKFDSESVTVDQEKHDVLMKIVNELSPDFYSKYPVNSPERIFWEQQLKASKVKSPNGMRWHPKIIKWCISLFSKSPAAYEQLSKAGFITLPCRSTLKKYINFTTSMPDINPDILELVSQEFDVENAPDYKKNVCLVWDEMKIKSGIAVAKNTGKLVGFCHLENSDVDFDNLLGSKTKNDKEPATHVMVLMVRGILSNVNIPFLWYPCKTFSSLQLINVVWKATKALEALGLKVRCWACDGAATNRTFFSFHKKLGLDYNGVTYSTVNRCDKSRQIYFICDVPHLIKTVRNNLENSHGHLNSKNLVKGGVEISWAHIVSTAQEDKNKRDLNKLYKIGDEHIHLSPQLRMRVKLAAQVLSTTMSHALIARNKPELLATAEFCQIFDSWFDCLNGRYLREGIHTRKPNLNPYSQTSDKRFEWLQNDFLGWLEDWEGEVIKLNLPKSEKNRLILSRQTMDGLKITTISFISLTKQLLSEPGVKFLLPEKLNQDRLETFFGKLRRGCGDTDNPTADQIRHRILCLIVAGQCFIPPKNRNCPIVDDDVEAKKCFPLMKKQKKSKC
jgi:hypothetical protein